MSLKLRLQQQWKSEKEKGQALVEFALVLIFIIIPVTCFHHDLPILINGFGSIQQNGYASLLYLILAAVYQIAAG